MYLAKIGGVVVSRAVLSMRPILDICTSKNRAQCKLKNLPKEI